jgi:hypothetical protein
MMKYILTLGLVTVILCGAYKAGAQGMAVNTSGAAASSSAMLDVSSTTQGVLVPRMTAAQRGAITGVQGLLVYQTDAPAGFYYYNGGWISLLASSSTLDATKLSGALPALNGAALTNLPSSNIIPLGGTLANGATISGTSTNVVYFTANGNAVYLPSATSATAGQEIIILDTNPSGNGFTVGSTGGDRIIDEYNGATGLTILPGAYKYTLVSDGAGHWYTTVFP